VNTTQIRWVGGPVVLLAIVGAVLMVGGCSGTPAAIEKLDVPSEARARLVVFYADDCEICTSIQTEVLAPLQERCKASLELKLVDIGQAEGYTAFLDAEIALVGEAGRWTIPAVVMGERSFVGESAIRNDMVDYLACVFEGGGNDWPEVESLRDLPVAPSPEASGGLFGATEGVELCVDDAGGGDVCASPNPIFALYLAESTCDEQCDRTLYDLRYLQGVYPQLSIEERAIGEYRVLSEKLADHFGVPDTLRGVVPVVVIGETYLAGDALNLDALTATVSEYVESGAPAIWISLGDD